MTTDAQQRFEELYNTYAPSMYRVALGVLRDQGYAEDAVQQSFMKIYSELDNIEDIHSNKTKAFVVILVRNTAIDLYRKRKREQVIYFQDLERDPSDSHATPEQSAIDAQSEEGVRRLLGAMGEKYAQILLLRYCHGYRNKEIAELLNMSEAAVASRIFQAKRLLTKSLQMQRLREA